MYIIAHYFLTEKEDIDNTFGYYIKIDENNGQFFEIRDPNFATIFESKEAAREWIENNSTFSDESKIVEINRHLELWEESAKLGHIRRSFQMATANPLNYRFDPKTHDWKDIVKWKFLYRSSPDDRSILKDVYKSWSFLQVTDYIWDVVGFVDYENHTNSATFELYFPKDRELTYKSFETQILYLIENFDLHRDENNRTMFTIVDHTLGEYGVFVRLFLESDGSWSVETTRHDVLKRVSLVHAFNYLVKHHYYD